MTRIFLSIWTIVAGLVAIGLGGWMCTDSVIVGLALMILGFLILGMGALTIGAGAARPTVVRQAPALVVATAVPRSNRREARSHVRIAT